jgi:PHP family Zn ribbon phosphoesterase
MDKSKLKVEINIILNTYGCRSIDPQGLKSALYNLVEKYSTEVNIFNYTPKDDASRTRNRIKKGRSL